MATAINVYLPDPEQQDKLQLALEDLLGDYPGDWQIIVIEKAESPDWVMTIQDPNNGKHRLEFSGTAEQDIAWLRRTVEEFVGGWLSTNEPDDL